MKLFNISLFILGITLFISCSEEEVVNISSQGKEVPVTVNLGFGAQTPIQTQTKAMSDEAENTVNDLYVFIFNEDGSSLKSKKYFLPTPSSSEEGQLNPSDKGAGVIQMETTSGKSLIYAVANVATNEMSEDLKLTLDKVTCLSDLKEISTSLKNNSIDRSVAAMLMSGVYGSNGICDISIKDNQTNVELTESINLKRLDSRIKFLIIPAKNIQFTPKTWKVINVPQNAKLIETDTDLPDAQKNIFESAAKVQFEKFNGALGFEYYMLENLKESQIYDGSKAKTYSDRERQKKTSIENSSKPGQTVENGEYLYAPANATYVEIKGVLELNGGKTIADVKYIVHLGYEGARPDPADFNSRRNYRYTYTVHINGVNDIIVEVLGEGGESPIERNPGVEGDVVEADTKVFDLDCHYNTFNIELQAGEAVKFQAITPFATVSDEDYKKASPDAEDIDWIKFIQTNNKSQLATYKKEKALNINGLNDELKTKTGTVNYTVFVNEYYYENPPKGSSWSKPYWHHFVNQTERKMMIMFSPRYSADGASSYAKAKYLVRQKSIQTCYNTIADKGIGVEHINETGPLSYGNLSDYVKRNSQDKSNGLSNMLKQIEENKKWENYISTTYSNTYKGGVGNLLKAAYAACLQRNRDENGDGYIQGDEVKWYMPARNQAIDLWIGARSLSTPLYNYIDHPTEPSAENVNIWANNFYISAGGSTLLPTDVWTAEGASIGNTNVTNKRQVRCIRNLGLDVPQNTSFEDVQRSYSLVESPYRKDGNYKIDLTNLDQQSLRSGVIENAEQVITTLFDSNNLPYNKFQVAKSDYCTSDGAWTRLNPTESKSACSNYSETGYPQGSWRAPNQRELMIMYALDYFSNNKIYSNKEGNNCINIVFSRTKWEYLREGQTRYFVVDQGTNFSHNTSGAWGYRVLRCVRDIK